MSDAVGTGLDAIARDLASGTISRRAALRRFGGVAVGVMLPGALFADSALARCPKDRRCDGKCCPKHGHCKDGKCKCDSGFTKCGRKCRNLKTDERNCGKCGHECADGETCLKGKCVAPAQCHSPTDCPDPGECLVATCVGGVCGAGFAGSNVSCSTGHCDGAGNCVGVCGDDVIGAGEVCDGLDLSGQSCASQGFAGGVLACAGDCQSFDTSACTKNPGQPCSSPSECDSGNCIDGVCCAVPCTGPCTTCNQPGFEGTCRNVPFGEDPRDDCFPGPMLQGTCNGAGLCM